ncbi:MAG: hypothetical protein IJW49_11205 [Clostridia bacterium]|nr:hypothetical protein [Clostridia bacterium]
MKQRNQLALTLFFVGFLALGALLFWCFPDKPFSETEKRGLQEMPSLTRERWLSGEFSSQMNDYFADQFPMRDALVALKGACEIASGKGENNGILLGKNGQLAKRLFSVRLANGTQCDDMDAYDRAHIDGAIEGILRANEKLRVPFVALLPPRTLDVASAAFRYPAAYSDALAEQLRTGLKGKVTYLDLLPTYRERYENGEDVYYKTDHHWTTRGAYYAYTEILRAFDMETEILPEDAFSKQIATDRFFGTFWAAGGMRWVDPDRLELWYYGNESSFSVCADGVILPSLYSERYLQTGDPYAVFLDGTHDVVTVTHKEQSRPTLLILKDSFANALAPFLAQHFDLVLLNLSSARTDYTDLSALSQEYGADAVLLVYTLGNVINTDRLNRLQ